MADEHGKPTFANDVDGNQAPSIETTPGIIPQTPLPGHAPARPQADRPAPDSGHESGPVRPKP